MSKTNVAILGLGIMGFADLLVELRIPYASQVAVGVAEELMGFVQKQGKLASENLAGTRAPFPSYPESRLASTPAAPLRNACVTSIAPTGTISLLADCSSGIEPFFALSYRREVIGSTKTMDVHPAIVRFLSQEIVDPEPILTRIRATGRLDRALVPFFLGGTRILEAGQIKGPRTEDTGNRRAGNEITAGTNET